MANKNQSPAVAENGINETEARLALVEQKLEDHQLLLRALWRTVNIMLNMDVDLTDSLRNKDEDAIAPFLRNVPVYAWPEMPRDDVDYSILSSNLDRAERELPILKNRKNLAAGYDLACFTDGVSGSAKPTGKEIMNFIEEEADEETKENYRRWIMKFDEYLSAPPGNSERDLETIMQPKKPKLNN